MANEICALTATSTAAGPIITPTPVTKTRTITILCWVESEDVFPVDIDDNRLVSHLKHEIMKMKPKAFADVDIDKFKLWKVSIPMSNQLKNDIRKLDFPNEESLQPGDRLSEIFPNPGPTEETLHIVVRLPPNLPSASPLKRSRSILSNEIDKVIDKFLSKCRSRMQELVVNADDLSSFLSFWKPDPSADDAFKQHISKLCIPAVGQNNPSLLLHNLGEDKTKLEKERISRIPDIFRCREHTLLINTSGSGKTRLLLDGLCHHWGVYFSADAKEVGSQDFRKIFDDLNDQESDSKTTESIRHTEDTASRGLSQLLLARLLLLGLLVEEVQKNQQQVSSLQYRRLWVLLQVQPEQIFGAGIGDPFLELARLLRPANRYDLETRIRNKYRALFFQLDLSDQETFYCVMDEAQVTTDERNRSKDGLVRRPLLREIWLSWTTVLSINQMSLIISGTGINYAEVTRTLSSSVFKQENYGVKSYIGAFETQDDQADYIRQYIPADWTDVKWQAFLKRSWAWFRGRYGSTATLVSLILEIGYKSPHRTIDSYVKGFSAFNPTDGDEWTKQEPTHPPLPKFWKLDFARLNDMQVRTLVEYGFARTKAGPSSPQTVLDEPIAILAARNWVATFIRKSRETDVNWFSGVGEKREVVHLKRSATEDLDPRKRTKRFVL